MIKSTPVASFTILVLLWLRREIVPAFIAGLIVLCANAHRVRFAPAPQELPKGKRFTTAYCNVGMILLLLACLGMVALSAAA